MHNTLNFQIVNNNTLPVQVQVFAPPIPNKAPVPINITGFSIKWQLFQDTGTLPLITKSTLAGTIVITDAVNGIFNIMLNAADTVNLAQGNYLHEAVTVNSDGNPVTIVNNDPQISAGVVFIRQQLTVQ